MSLSHCTTIDRIFAREKAYLQQKQTICASSYTTIDLLLSKMEPQQKPCQTLLTVPSLLMTVLSLTMALWLQHLLILSLAT